MAVGTYWIKFFKTLQKFAIKTNEEIENKLNPQIGEKEMADLKIKLEELIILIDS